MQQSTHRQATPAEKATQRLRSACCALIEALAKTGPHERQRTIATLSEGLRQELISLREAQKPVLGDRQRGSIWSVKTAGGSYHRVRMTLHNVVVTSRRLSRPLAVDGLSHLRQAVLARRGAGFESVLRGLDHAGSRVEGGLGLSYQVVLDARAFLGRRLHSPGGSVEEAILLRRQVCDLQPGEVVQMGLRWAQELRHLKGRRWCWSKQKAEVVFSKMKHRLEATTGRSERRLKMKVQRAEAAMKEVKHVSDVVAAKRRWLSVSEASELQRVCLV